MVTTMGGEGVIQAGGWMQQNPGERSVEHEIVEEEEEEED